LRDTILKIPHAKRFGGVAQGIVPEFQPGYCKNENRKKKTCSPFLAMKEKQIKTT
jgi:hypothetical protein